MAVDMQELLRRKEDIMSGRIKPEDCESYKESLLEEATKDADIAAYFFGHDTVVNLVCERVKQRISQKEIAKRMGVSLKSVNEFEHGNERFITISFLVKYAMALNKKLTIQIEENVYENISSWWLKRKIEYI